LAFFQQPHFKETYFHRLPLEVLEIIYVHYLQSHSLEEWKLKVDKMVFYNNFSKRDLLLLEGLLSMLHDILFLRFERLEQKKKENFRKKNNLQFKSSKKKITLSFVKHLLGSTYKVESADHQIEILFLFYKHNCVERSTIVENAQNINYHFFTKIRHKMDEHDRQSQSQGLI
jgi:hypothetical protein